MLKEKRHQHSSSPKRFFKGVKSFLRGSSSKDLDQQDSFSKDGIAVTFTAEIHTKQHTGCPITLLHPNLSFLPSNQSMSSILLFQQEKAYVHYDPKRARITLGTNPSTKHHHQNTKKVFHLTVDQYTWLIQQLQEEQQHSLFADSSFHSPMLGVVWTHQSFTQTTKSFGKRLMRFVQQQGRRRRRNSSGQVDAAAPHRQCIFILPKALLLQTADYIPMAKPLPPLPPHETITNAYCSQLKRYCRSLSLGTTHKLLLTQQVTQEPSPPSSFVGSGGNEFMTLGCVDCPVTTGLQTLVQHNNTMQYTQEEATGSSTITEIMLFPSPYHHHASVSSLQSNNNSQSIMFPLSYAQYKTTNLIHAARKMQKEKETQADFMASALLPGRTMLFDSIAKKQILQTSSAFQYIPPNHRSTTMSLSGFSSISKSSDIDMDDDDDDDDDEDEGIVQQDGDNDKQYRRAPQKHGYVAVDTANEEILVVFPGMSSSSLLSHAMFENASFAAVPWLEIETITSRPPLHERKQHDLEEQQQEEEDELPWVLECALTAWHRCEMRVVTLLMRLCGVLPSHYKVVIIGHSLGGAVAALCASSLRSTKLLINRPITVCAIHPPRVGNKSFLKTLSYQTVKTIRITDDGDLMAHLPPRTSGLLHLGDSTIILPKTTTTTTGHGSSKGHSLQDMTLNQIEDTLNKTFESKDYDIQAHFRAWDVCLDGSCV